MSEDWIVYIDMPFTPEKFDERKRHEDMFRYIKKQVKAYEEEKNERGKNI